MDALITHLQIFGIGFTFGIAGPCLLVCTPIIVAYTAASQKGWADTLSDVFIFLSGRLSAYLLLGYLAGLSGTALRHFTDSNLSIFFKPLSGAAAIAFGVLLLTYKEHAGCPGAKSRKSVYGKSGLFLLGFSIGVVPCAPLVAILFNIVLLSKCALDGMAYAFSFGLGTLASGIIVISALTGAVKWIPAKLLKSGASNLVFKAICAALLILLGIRLMI
ncbi:MAG: sulfite exporter TauE/SafE family protein [Candidatus Omnitrophota bacterium]